MKSAKWHFTHESEDDRQRYGIFFSMGKSSVSWSKATATHKAVIEEITHVNYECKMMKRESRPNQFEDFLTRRFPPDPNCDPYGSWSRQNQWNKEVQIVSLFPAERLQPSPKGRKAHPDRSS